MPAVAEHEYDGLVRELAVESPREVEELGAGGHPCAPMLVAAADVEGKDEDGVVVFAPDPGEFGGAALNALESIVVYLAHPKHLVRIIGKTIVVVLFQHVGQACGRVAGAVERHVEVFEQLGDSNGEGRMLKISKRF